MAFKLPLLPKSDNGTGLIIYHIQQGDTDFNTYYLYKSIIRPGGELQQDTDFLISYNDLDTLHQAVTDQGFIPMIPSPDDDPRIMMTYL